MDLNKMDHSEKWKNYHFLKINELQNKTVIKFVEQIFKKTIVLQNRQIFEKKQPLFWTNDFI